MRSFAIIGRECGQLTAPGHERGFLEIEGVGIRCGLVEGQAPELDPLRPDTVLLRTLAFSLNFRDRALILRMATSNRQDGYYVVGSDFVGEVLEVGPAVTDLRPGDRVIPDGAWPPDGQRFGLPTNHGSAEIQVLRRDQLMRVGPGMGIPEAAAFTVCAQTATAMIRRLDLRAGQRVLVTAPHSNTSLFVLARLAGLGIEAHGVATSDRHANVLARLGLARLTVIEPGTTPLQAHPDFAGIFAEGGYEAVIDPFFDLYLPRIGGVLAIGGRYITCGFEDQSSIYTAMERPAAGAGLTAALATAMIKNQSIIGNCLGGTADLADAVAAHGDGRFDVVIDRLYRDDPAGFLERTYRSRERLGKVVFAY